MGTDELKFTDTKTQENIVFNLYTFGELLKGCLQKYSNIPTKKANDLVETCKLFKAPINTANDVYFFSHEHPYHWAMICLHGDMYWEKNQSLLQIPEDYNSWEKDYINTNNLKNEIFVFE